MFAQPGNLPAPYCMPAYNMTPCNNPGPSNSPGNFINDFINSVKTIGGNVDINNLNTGCNSQNFFSSFGIRNYIYHKCQHNLTATPGQAITFSVGVGILYAQGVAIFIDWNLDNVFQTPGEMVAATPATIPGGSWATLTVNIPPAQPNGIYRMRIRCVQNTFGTAINPCNMHYSGEVEDYDVYVGSVSPAISAQASSNSTLCSGNTLSLNLTYTSQCTPTFTWVGPNNFTSNSQNPTIASAQTSLSGIYSVTASCGPCPVSLSTSVTVKQSPTPANAGPSMTLCAQNTTTFMAGNIPSIGQGTWSVVSGAANFLQVNQANTGTTFLPPNPYNVLAWTTSNQGCTSTSTMSVTFFTPTIANAGPSQSLCMQTTATLTGNAPSVGTGSWSVVSGSATIGSPTSPTTNITSLGLGVSVFKWTLSNGFCSPTVSQMTITNFVMPTVSIVSSASAVCANSSATITASGATNYNWLPSGSGSVIVVTPSVATSYTVIANNGPCFDNSSINIGVDQPPTISNAMQSFSLCAQSTTTLGANSPTVGVATWSLISGTGTISSLLNPTTSVTNLGTGNSIFAWIITNGVCPPSVSNVTVSNYSVPNLIVTHHPSLICVGDQATLTASGALNYSWVPGGNSITNIVSPTITTNYVLIGSNGPCTSSIVVTQSVSVCTGINEIDLNNIEFLISPNPFKDELNIKTKGIQEVLMFDVNGKLVMSKQIEGFGTIRTEHLSKGIYFIELKGTKMKPVKVIKD
ncbi:MAG: GEVED domain-containing protein [Sphingobacteriaceae bacterium]